jgi:CBS domain-containing protein
MKNADLIVEKNQSIKIAMEKILINDLRIVFVVENKKIIGSLSEGDILRSVFFKKNLENPVHIIMNKSFKFILEKDLKEENIKFFFINNDILVLPVVNNNLELVKIITLRNFLLK